MGQVFKAIQEGLEREVALKILAPNLLSNPEMAARFRREILICARLQHPNLVKVYDEGEENGVTFFAMEYFPGVPLQAHLARQGPLGSQAALRIIGQVTQALHFIHKEGMIHRDVKPSNIMLGDDDTVKLMDFGLARDVTRGAMTQTGTLLGTLAYMSPEMIRGDKVDLRSDIYQIGVVLFELLTMKLPVTQEDVFRIARGDDDVEPASLAVYRPDIPLPVRNFVANILTLYQDDRYQRVRDMARDLNAAAAGQEVPLLPGVAKRVDTGNPNGQGRSRSRPDPVMISGIPPPGAPAKPEDMFRLVRKARKLRKGPYARLAIWGKALIICLAGWGVIAALWFGWHMSQDPGPTPSAVDTATASPGGEPDPAASLPSTGPTSIVCPYASRLAEGPDGLVIYKHELDKAEMVLVPGGCCKAVDPRATQQGPRRTMVDSFLMDRYEVTNAQFQNFMADYKYRAPALSKDLLFNGMQQPVVGVTLEDALNYCKWSRKRLPTLLEWQRAARGEQDILYPWGQRGPNDGGIFRAKCSMGSKNTAESSDGGVSPGRVGTHPEGRSYCGCDDLSGNVAEWVSDTYGTVAPIPASSSTPAVDKLWEDAFVPVRALAPPPIQGPRYGLVMGGSWLDRENEITTTSWRRVSADAAYKNVGFRTVCE
jgi:formylglycine-generating enzyme required for sulfatase activity